MRSSDILGAINEIERRYPVANWKIDGVRIWPLVRVQLYTETLNAQLLRHETPTRLVRVRKALARAVRAQLRMVKARWRDRAANARLGGRAEAVFLSDGVSFVKVGGLWYDKIFDPLIDTLRAQRRTWMMLTPMTQAHFPRRSASMFVQPQLDRIRVYSLLRRARAREMLLDGLEQVRAELERSAFVTDALKQSKLEHMWQRLSATARYFDDVLRRTAPTRAFVNTYYSMDGMAFVLACRRRGIVVADVQHGVQGPHHVAYGSWLAMPPTGYELLPDEFWVWSEREQCAIDAWRPRETPVHCAVVTGNPWLELWKSTDSDWVRSELGRAEVLYGAPGDKRVLVTLQWGLAEEETLKILRAAQLVPRTWQWWFRLHPVVAHDRSAIKAQLRGAGLGHANVDLATDLPLHALLRMADVHVTHSSSTVLEALEFGVPSIVTSPYGAELFAAEISSGRVSSACTDTAIAAAVAASRREQTEKRSDAPRVVLANVMAAAERRALRPVDGAASVQVAPSSRADQNWQTRKAHDK